VVRLTSTRGTVALTGHQVQPVGQLSFGHGAGKASNAPARKSGCQKTGHSARATTGTGTASPSPPCHTGWSAASGTGPGRWLNPLPFMRTLRAARTHPKGRSSRQSAWKQASAHVLPNTDRAQAISFGRSASKLSSSRRTGSSSGWARGIKEGYTVGIPITYIRHMAITYYL